MSFLNAKTVCPHCNRESADNQVCTSLGCGKRIDAPVRLFARVRRLPVVGPLETRPKVVSQGGRRNGSRAKRSGGS